MNVEATDRRRSGWGRVALGAAIAAALILWFARGVDVAAVVTTLGEAHLGWVLAAALFQVSALTVRGWRWRTLLERRGRVPLANALAVTFMGWVALVLVPARIGELARPWLLGRRQRFDRSFAFGAQQLERVLDLLVMLALLALYLASATRPVALAEARDLHSALARGEQLLLVLVLALLVALMVTVAWAPRLERTLAPRFGALWSRRLLAFAHGLTAIRSTGCLATSAAQSCLLWFCVAATHACLFRAFELDLPLVAIPPILAFVVLGALVPAPAAVGSYHKAVQSVLTLLLGVPMTLATGYALVGHLVAYLPNLAIGSVLLAREGVSLAELRARADRPAGTGA